MCATQKTNQITARVPDLWGELADVAVTVSPGRDSWGREATGCGSTSPRGRTTWTVCDKPVAGYLVAKDGAATAACKQHIATAKRRRTSGYYTDPQAILDADMVQTHEWVCTSAGRGYFTEAASS